MSIDSSITPRTTSYAGGDGRPLGLHVFTPARPSGAGVIFFHGGGWKMGAAQQFFPQCAHLAASGIAAATAAYRLVGQGAATGADCVLDARLAFDWFRVNGDVEARRVAVGGGSAGGHLAACCGIVPADGRGPGGTSAALVLFNPALTFDGIPDGSEALITAAGGRTHVPEPIAHVRPGLPPTLVMHGTADTVLPIDGIRQFRDRMVADGNQCELVEFENAGHGFFNRTPQRSVWYDETTSLAEQFLRAALSV